MKLTNLTKVYILKPTKTKVDGEVQTVWTKISSCNVNIQQDYNELDKNTSGTIDYSIYNIRINKDVGIKNGYGLTYSKISTIPDLIISSEIIIKNTRLYKAKKVIK